MSAGFGSTVYVGRPEGFSASGCDDAFLLDFAPDLAPGEIREACIDDRSCLWIAERWRGIGDDFGQQLLNRRFATRLLAGVPSRVLLAEVYGATLDLAKLAALFGVEVRLGPAALAPQGERASRWLEQVRRLCAQGGGGEGVTAGYESYAFSQRDHALLYQMQRPLVRHFKGCSTVLDVGCGTGLFLEALERAGHRPTGVERNALSARYAQALGHEVIESGAFEFLADSGRCFDGVYCSHFVEHLPIEAVERLIALVAGTIAPGGCAVFTFPDPESIRSQLLGFWRDPEHVRFYHPDLIEMICSMHGLQCEYHSQRVPGRRIVSFAMEAPLFDPPGNEAEESGEPPAGLADKLFGWFGAGHRLRALEQRVAALSRENERAKRREAELESAVRKLWEVNQTWAWEDNAVLRMRKAP